MWGRRLLVDESRRFMRGMGDHEVICPDTEKAADFWQVMGCPTVYDGRTGDPPSGAGHLGPSMLEPN